MAVKDELLCISLCCVLALIKSECFIESRLSPYFLFSSTKSAVSSNAGSELMWLMKARCGSLQQRSHLQSTEELTYSVPFQRGQICGRLWHTIHIVGGSDCKSNTSGLVWTGGGFNTTRFYFFVPALVWISKTRAHLSKRVIVKAWGVLLHLLPAWAQSQVFKYSMLFKEGDSLFVVGVMGGRMALTGTGL